MSGCSSNNVCTFVPKMNRVTSILLAVVISAQAFFNVGVVGYWLANRAYIAANLCENRDKPLKHCNGKCYLKKNLSSSPTGQDNGKSALPVLKNATDVSVFLVEMPLLLPELPGLTTSVLITCVHAIQSRLTVGGVFHPPAGKF